MFYLKKEKLLFILSCIFFSFITMIPQKTIETSSLPLVQKTVILDAGHGLPDCGAIASDGTIESDLNLLITLKLQQILESSGYSVVLTRNNKYSLSNPNDSNKKKTDFKNRINIANNSNATCFISIHLNKINIESCNGFQTFYQFKNENSKQLASYIQSNLTNYLSPKKQREILPLKDKYIMEKNTIPTVIIECGFLSNPEDLNNLKNSDYQSKLAWGIYCGIVDYFSKVML